MDRWYCNQMDRWYGQRCVSGSVRVEQWRVGGSPVCFLSKALVVNKNEMRDFESIRQHSGQVALASTKLDEKAVLAALLQYRMRAPGSAQQKALKLNAKDSTERVANTGVLEVNAKDSSTCLVSKGADTECGGQQRMLEIQG